MEQAKKTKCYKRLIYKQFVQVSGLCDPQFLSYLPKRITYHCRALYGDATDWTPIWPPEINKNIWSSLFLLKALFFTRVLEFGRIDISSNTWNGYTAENQEERLFFNETAFLFSIGVTHCQNLEVQIAVFSKWNMLREWKLVQRFTFCLSST